MADLAARAIAASQPDARPSLRIDPVDATHNGATAPVDRESAISFASATSQRSPLVWALIAAAAGFGAVFAWFAAQRMFPPQPSGPATSLASAGPAATGRPPARAPGISDNALEEVGDDDLADQLAGVLDAGTATTDPHTAAAAHGSHGASSTSSNSNALPMPVSAGGTMSTESFDSSTHVRPATVQPLDATQISAVVRRSQSRAQRCYETAATMNGRAPDMRLSVSLAINPSGGVSSVEIDGADFGGTIACVRRTVMTWQFPASTAGGHTTFSLVFTGQ